MPKPYNWLRGELQKNDIDEPYLADLIGRKVTYVSQRLMGHKSWEQHEMYQIMDIIRQPYDQLHIYFPPKGRAKEA